MAHKNRDVPDASGASASSSTGQQLYTYPPTSTPAASSSPSHPVVPMDTDADQKALGATIFKGPKRKRLVKACDACHKSKRRCDGTAPCGNCYFASKECTYTDSAGRPVPAPNALRHEPVTSSSSSHGSHPSHSNVASTSASAAAGATQDVQLQLTTPGGSFGYAGAAPPGAGPGASTGAPSSTSTRFIFDDGKESLPQPHSRKRPREDRINHAAEMTAAAVASAAGTQPPHPHSHSSGRGMVASGSVPAAVLTADGYAGMERRYTRVLVNLFFAHCYPHRLMIHAPTFLSELGFDRIPPYLINAVCAIAAPISRMFSNRETPVRFAGQPFVQCALSALFDADHNLVAPLSLATAQTLCLLQAHKIYVESSMDGDFQFFDLAMKILTDLDVHKTDNPILTSVPSVDLRQKSIERECMRRTVWFVHLIELLGSIFVHRPMSLKPQELLLRLPCDETSFEIASHLSVPEYLSITAPKTHLASEFGHVIRVARILCDIEKQDTEVPDLQAITECEGKLNAWALTVADHLRFTPENLQDQLELWVSSSNSSAWCFAYVHVLHAACVAALCDIRMRLGQPLLRERHAAFNAVSAIIAAIGNRARNSILMGMVLWLEYCGPHAQHLQQRPEDLPPGSAIGSGIERGVSVAGFGGGSGGGGGGAGAGSISKAGVPATVNPAASSAGGDEGGNGAVGEGAGSGSRGGKVRAWIPDLQPQLDALLKDWEEIWGPVRIHPRAGGLGMGMGPGALQTRQQVQVQWSVEGVIDPVLRSGGRPHMHMQQPPPQSLPSLKASGLLDVIGEGERERGGSASGSRGSWPRGSADLGGQPSSATAISPSGLAMPAPSSGVATVLGGPGSIVGPGVTGPMTSSHRGSVSAPTTPSEAPGGYPARVYTHTQTHMHTQTYFVDHPHISPPPPLPAATGTAFRSPPPHAASPGTRRASRALQPQQPPGASPATPSAANGNEPAVPSAQQASSLRR